LINLGSAQREFENLYVKNLHVSGSDSGGAQKGTTAQTTDASTGLLTVSFPTAFPAGTIPVVTCTPIDTNGRTISLVIINRTNQNFTVKATLAGTESHKHKVGDAWGTSTFNWNINNNGDHYHAVQGWTASANANHGHGMTGSTASGGSHTHGINFNPQQSPWTSNNGNTGQVHQHQYYIGTFPSATNSDGAHTHGAGSLTVSSADATHYHLFDTAQTGTDGAHNHTFATAKPGYTRSIGFLNASGGHVDSGGMLLAQAESQTELHTGNASGGSGVGSPVAVYFCWMAM
jgi:hypothetical protein